MQMGQKNTETAFQAKKVKEQEQGGGRGKGDEKNSGRGWFYCLYTRPRKENNKRVLHSSGFASLTRYYTRPRKARVFFPAGLFEREKALNGYSLRIFRFDLIRGLPTRSRKKKKVKRKISKFFLLIIQKSEKAPASYRINRQSRPVS